MIRNYPTTIEIFEKSDDDLKIRLSSLKNLFINEINHTLFGEVITNLHNHQHRQPSTWHKKTLAEWETFMNSFLSSSINQKQLELIFNYLIKYHFGIIRKNDNKYDMTKYDLSYDDKFILEYIALMTLEL